jgi:hypothetical protein
MRTIQYVSSIRVLTFLAASTANKRAFLLLILSVCVVCPTIETYAKSTPGDDASFHRTLFYSVDHTTHDVPSPRTKIVRDDRLSARFISPELFFDEVNMIAF